MGTLSLRVQLPSLNDFRSADGRRALHIARAFMLQRMADDLHLQIASWGNTDSIAYPNEVEILIVVSSQAEATAIAHYVRRWLLNGQVGELTVVPAQREAVRISEILTYEPERLGEFLWGCRDDSADRGEKPH